MVSEHLQNNFQKALKTDFLIPKMSKMTLSEGQILTKTFDFWGHLSTFRAKNTHKSWPFKAKNNAQITSEHHQNNFKKSQKNDFFCPQNGQNDPLRGPIFDIKFWF